MKYLGGKEENVEYKKRPGSYAIITRKEDDKVAIVTDGEIFFLGGGMEEGETQIDTLKRELIEETGYSIKNIRKFDEVHSYVYSKTYGYIECEAYVHIAEFDELVTEPIEKDHTVLWVNPEEYIGKMYRPWQNYILQEFIERRNEFKV